MRSLHSQKEWVFVCLCAHKHLWSTEVGKKAQQFK